jgi:membrane protein implicated in regulation of membrane protease activity
MPWWGWIVVGAALLCSEIVVATDFFLVFLGMAALGVGLLGLVGLGGPVWAQWLIFAALAVGSLLLFRSRVHRRFEARGGPLDATLVGETALTQERIDPGATGRAELRGAVWTARNVDAVALEQGTRARVERIEGLVIHVRREG